jgi:hypothetical protein
VGGQLLPEEFWKLAEENARSYLTNRISEQKETNPREERSKVR